jgi:hypothetical protein
MPPPGPPPPECALDGARAATVLCKDRAVCPIRQAVTIRCQGTREIDLAVSRRGRALLALRTFGDKVFALDILPGEEAKLARVGPALAAVAAIHPDENGSGGRILTRSYPSSFSLARLDAAGWKMDCCCRCGLGVFTS